MCAICALSRCYHVCCSFYWTPCLIWNSGRPLLCCQLPYLELRETFFVVLSCSYLVAIMQIAVSLYAIFVLSLCYLVCYLGIVYSKIDYAILIAL